MCGWGSALVSGVDSGVVEEDVNSWLRRKALVIFDFLFGLRIKKSKPLDICINILDLQLREISTSKTSSYPDEPFT